MFVADVCMKINRWKLEALGCNTKQESNEHSHVLDHSHQFFLDTTATFSKSGTDVAPREEKIQSKVESYKNDCNPQEPPNEWDPHACEVQSTLAFSWKFSNYTLFPCEVSRPKLGIFELGLDSGETDARSDGSVYTRSGLPWGANLTDFTGIESSGGLETRLGRVSEDFSIRISRVLVKMIFDSSLSLCLLIYEASFRQSLAFWIRSLLSPVFLCALYNPQLWQRCSVLRRQKARRPRDDNITGRRNMLGMGIFHDTIW